MKLTSDGSVGKESSCDAGDRSGLNPWVGKIPWRRKWQPTPVFLPGKSHGQRSLVTVQWVAKDSDTAEHKVPRARTHTRARART